MRGPDYCHEFHVKPSGARQAPLRCFVLTPNTSSMELQACSRVRGWLLDRRWARAFHSRGLTTHHVATNVIIFRGGRMSRKPTRKLCWLALRGGPVQTFARVVWHSLSPICCSVVSTPSTGTISRCIYLAVKFNSDLSLA